MTIVHAVHHPSPLPPSPCYDAPDVRAAELALAPLQYYLLVAGHATPCDHKSKLHRSTYGNLAVFLTPLCPEAIGDQVANCAACENTWACLCLSMGISGITGFAWTKCRAHTPFQLDQSLDAADEAAGASGAAGEGLGLCFTTFLPLLCCFGRFQKRKLPLAPPGIAGFASSDFCCLMALIGCEHFNIVEFCSWINCKCKDWLRAANF